MLVHQAGMSHPTSGGAHRLRFASETVDERIEAVRRWFAAQRRPQFLWWIGGSATPSDLEERLLAQGAEPWEDGAITTMLTDTPPPAVGDVDVRRVETYEDFVVAREIWFEAAELTPEQEREARGSLRERWEARVRAGDAAAFLAYVDGEPAASAEMLFLPFAAFLSGATTRPERRGRGAFRALVRARWDEAVRHGTPALVVGAGRMSRPILERSGFRAVAELHLVLDRSTSS